MRNGHNFTLQYLLSLNTFTIKSQSFLKFEILIITLCVLLFHIITGLLINDRKEIFQYQTRSCTLYYNSIYKKKKNVKVFFEF